MTTRIFLGGLMFIAMFIVVGYILLNEGLLDVQAQEGSGRMQIFKSSQDGLAIERGADIFEQFCRVCHGDRGEGVPGRGPELNPYLFTTRFPELKADNYPNTLSNFLRLTIAGGRPLFSTYWADRGGVYAEHMPTWSQDFGGPLRPDRVDAVTSYILTWEAASDGGTPIAAFDAVGSDVTAELPEGDATRGAQLFNKDIPQASGKVTACSACHSLDAGTTLIGPSLNGIGTSAADTVGGQDAATYIRHSIQTPGDFIVEGATFVTADGASVMPVGLGDNMDAQDLADLIAFLLTQ